jgi:DNA-binding winged helix-turn-helix (wHTH) protein/tetratricopeptide (TPR) repeat protein
MSARIYRFGAFRIDAHARELRRDGELLVVSPKVFDCIVYLIEHRERAVGRDELVAAVWGKVDVGDPLLGQILVKARRVLGDTGSEQWAIRTVPRFGYRWVADLEIEAETPATEAPPASARERAAGPVTPATSTRRRDWSRPRPAPAAAMLALLAAGSAGFAWWVIGRAPQEPRSASAPPAESIAADAAVLPFAVDADTDASWVRLGAMEYVANRLQRAGLAVVPSANVVAVSHQRNDSAGPATAEAVRAMTGARHLIAPAASQTRQGWRVRLRWLGATEDERVVEARATDVLTAAEAATDRLLAVLGRTVPAAASERPDPPRAELVSRIKAALLVADLARARELIEAAPADLRETPELVLLHAEVDERAGRFPAARARLVELAGRVGAESEPELRARLLNGLGNVEAQAGNALAAERHFGEALARLEGREAPNESARARVGLGVTHALLGRIDQAGSDFASARVIYESLGDTLGLAWVEANQGRIEMLRNHPAAALALFESAARRFERLGLPNELPIVLGAQIGARLALLQPAAALATAERAATPLPDDATPAQRFLAWQHARALIANGRFASARDVLDRLVATDDPAGEPGFRGQVQAELARLDLATGNVERALEAVQRALADLDGADYARDRATAARLGIQALRALGRDADAQAAVARFSTAAEATGTQPGMLYAALAAAEQSWPDARETAMLAYERALSAALGLGVPADVAAVAVSWGERLIAAGDLARASEVAGRIARWADHDYDCAILQARLYRALGQRRPWQAALEKARALAGERRLPATLMMPAAPTPTGPAGTDNASTAKR